MILASLYLLNDFFLAMAFSWQGYVAVDYATRFLTLGLLWFWWKRKKMDLPDLGFTFPGWKAFAGWSLLLSGTGILILGLLEYNPTPWNNATALVSFFPITDSGWKLFDLYGGLLLVALTEEIVFRGLFLAAFRERFRSPAALVAVSSLVFALIHWSAGFDAVLAAFLWALLPMVSVLRTGSIFPAIIAHFLGNYALFSGLLPKELFTL